MIEILVGDLKIVRDEGGEWIGLYEDGQLLDQGHSFQEERLLDLLNIPYKVISDWDGETHGSLPHLFRNLPKKEAS